MGFLRRRNVFDHSDFEFVVEVLLPLESFREYLKVSDDQIISTLRGKVLKYDHFILNEEKETIREFYDFEGHEIAKQTLQLHFSSMFISLYSFLERKLFQVCKLAEVSGHRKLADIRGKGIWRYQRYIDQVLRINLMPVNEQWMAFTKYNLLRNLLVHQSSYSIDVAEVDKINHLRGIGGLILTEKNGIVEFELKDKQILVDFVRDIKIYLEYICYERI